MIEVWIDGGEVRCCQDEGRCVPVEAFKVGEALGWLFWRCVTCGGLTAEVPIPLAFRPGGLEGRARRVLRSRRLGSLEEQHGQEA